MTLQHVNTSFDCADALKVGTFWSQALGRPLAEGANQYFAMIPPSGPGELSWLFMAVPEPKTAKNRVHVDLSSTDRAVDVERLISLGAEKVGDYDEYGISWTTLRDVEGNEFCISDPHDMSGTDSAGSTQTVGSAGSVPPADDSISENFDVAQVEATSAPVPPPADASTV